MKESEATERLIKKHGPVSALRLLGYLYKLDTEGEQWLYEHISRQQLNHVKASFAEAEVPFERGASWPIVMLVADRDVRVVSAEDGELLRHLTLDPSRNYQRQSA